MSCAWHSGVRKLWSQPSSNLVLSGRKMKRLSVQERTRRCHITAANGRRTWRQRCLTLSVVLGWCLDQRFSKCGSQPAASEAPGNFIREANSWACPRLCFHNSSRWCLPKLKNHCFKEKVTWAGKRPQKTHRTFIIKVRGHLSSSSLTLVSWFTPYYLIWPLQPQDWRQRRKAEKA